METRDLQAMAVSMRVVGGYRRAPRGTLEDGEKEKAVTRERCDTLLLLSSAKEVGVVWELGSILDGGTRARLQRPVLCSAS